MFIRFNRINECDRQTDRHRTMAQTISYVQYHVAMIWYGMV